MTLLVLCACNPAREDFLEEAGLRQGKGLPGHSWLQGCLWGMTGCALEEWGLGFGSRDQQGGCMENRADEQHECRCKRKRGRKGESLGTAFVRNGREGGQQYQLLPKIKGGVCQVSLGTLGVATSFEN